MTDYSDQRNRTERPIYMYLSDEVYDYDSYNWR